LLISAARDLFSSQGYAGASTRDIARRADVSEALLFRHFGTKASLFQKAILDPLSEFVSEYIAGTEAYMSTPHTPDLPTRHYVEGMYRRLRDNRELVMAAMAAHAFESGPAGDMAAASSPIGDLLDRLEGVVRHEAQFFGYDGLDVPVTTRVVFSMVMGMAVFDEWMFPPGARHPTEKRMIDEMVAFMLDGVGHRQSTNGR
jgi:AcrR family transcriptional regulator